MNNEKLKQRVQTYWNNQSCGTNFADAQKFSPNYFEQIEKHRYTTEADIFSFAQFTRFHGKKVLEVGIGAGTDFLQFVRAGAQVYGIDLTQEAVDHVKQRLHVYGLQAAEVCVADAEALPYEKNSFDLVYSWGVIHHSPDTQKCLSEIVRVTKPNGTIKIMVYNRYSIYALYLYLRFGLLKGRPWKSVKNILFHNQESLGTQAFTKQEVYQMLSIHPVKDIIVQTWMMPHDLSYRSLMVRTFFYIVACLLGWRHTGWFMTIECIKK